MLYLLAKENVINCIAVVVTFYFIIEKIYLINPIKINEVKIENGITFAEFQNFVHPDYYLVVILIGLGTFITLGISVYYFEKVLSKVKYNEVF